MSALPPSAAPTAGAGARRVETFADEAALLRSAAAWASEPGPALLVSSAARREALGPTTRDLTWVDADALLTGLPADEPAALAHLAAALPPAPRRVWTDTSDLLLRRGDANGAVRLDELWDALAALRDLAVVCAHVRPADPAPLEAALRAALDARRRGEAAVRTREAFLSGALHSGPDCVKVLDLEGRLLFVSQGGLRALGCEEGALLGQPWSELWDQPDRARARAALTEACAGRPGAFSAALPARPGGAGPTHWEVRLSPIAGLNGVAHQVLAISRDVSDRQRAAEAELREREDALSLLVEQVRDYAIFLLDPEGRVRSWNVGAERLEGYTADQILGRHFSVFYPPEQVAADWPGEELRRAAAEGRFEDEGPRLRRDGSRFVANVVITALRDAEGRLRGFAKVVRDVTERFTRAEERLRLALGVAGLGVFEWHVPSDQVVWEDDRIYEIFGRQRAEGPLDMTTLRTRVVHPEDRAAFERALHQAASPGSPLAVACRILRPDGQLRWIRCAARSEQSDSGQPLRLVGVIEDVTEARRALEALEQEHFIRDTLLGLGKRFASELDHDRLVRAITDEATRLTGAQFGAYFENVVDAQGESYLLYTISGVPSERFASFPAPRNTAVFAPTFAGEGTVRLDDVRADPRFGQNPPYHGMPAGHLPVRSYLAVPVRSRSGQVLGGLFFGHAEVGVFRAEHERLIEGLSAQAAVALDNASLYQAQRRSEEAFRQLANAMPQIVWAARADGVVDYYNERWYQFTGSPRQLTGDPSWTPYLHPADLPQALAEYRAAIAAGVPYTAEYRLREQVSGDYHWILSRALPVRDEAGQIVRWFGTGTDISAQKRDQEALREADRRKDEFLAMLAHELRNPLAPIATALHLARARAGEREELRRPLEIMSRQAQHLSKLVDDLLEVSRITRGKIRLDCQVLEAQQAVTRAVEAARPLLDQKGQRLTVSVPAAPVWLSADLTRLAQVLGNLLDNAAKYTDEGGQVWLSLEVVGDRALFRVRDDGIGIDPGLLPRLFDLFVQADTSLDRQRGGLGIGLTLVRTLVELHGGAVEAWSEGEGRGAELRVWLPLVAGPAARATPRPATLVDPAPCRVVVVDDNHDAAESLAELLSEAGHAVKVAYDGPTALDAVREHHPDVVLLDIGLPHLDGYQVARALRAEHGLHPELVALTGYGQEEDRRRAAEAGFDHHLVKPVDVDALIGLLGQASARAGG